MPVKWNRFDPMRLHFNFPIWPSNTFFVHNYQLLIVIHKIIGYTVYNWPCFMFRFCWITKLTAVKLRSVLIITPPLRNVETPVCLDTVRLSYHTYHFYIVDVDYICLYSCCLSVSSWQLCSCVVWYGRYTGLYSLSAPLWSLDHQRNHSSKRKTLYQTNPY